MTTFEGLRFRLAERRFDKRWERFPKLIAGKSVLERRVLYARLETEGNELNERRRLFEERRVQRRARRLLVPPPSFERDSNDNFVNYELSSFVATHEFRRLLLKQDALARYREAVRREEAARREAAIAYVHPAIALIGALTGLVAVVGSFYYSRVAPPAQIARVVQQEKGAVQSGRRP